MYIKYLLTMMTGCKHCLSAVINVGSQVHLVQVLCADLMVRSAPRLTWNIWQSGQRLRI